MEKKKRIAKKFIALIVAGVFILIIGFAALGLYIGFWVCDGDAYVWTPGYDKMSSEDLKKLYLTAETDEEFQIIYEQTGLTRIGIERARAKLNGWTRVKAIHDNYFKQREIKKELFCPLICTDFISELSKEIYLERGDILITSSTHFSGFRIGHSGIVIAPETRFPVWQASAIGDENGYAEVESGFTSRINFMVVRIKPETFGAASAYDEIYKSAIDGVIEYIVNDLKDSIYNPVTGIFTKKDSCKYTQCSHLIWYGFKHFDDKNGGQRNIDLDSDGGLLVTPKDISNSPYIELVQTFGFDPEKMYE